MWSVYKLVEASFLRASKISNVSMGKLIIIAVEDIAYTSNEKTYFLSTMLQTHVFIVT
jgi:hypothetical protein